MAATDLFDFGNLKLVDKPECDRNAHNLPQTLHGCEGAYANHSRSGKMDKRATVGCFFYDKENLTDETIHSFQLLPPFNRLPR